MDGGRLALAGPLLLVAHQPGCATCGDVERALASLAAEAHVVSVLALPRAAAAAHPSPPGVPVVAAEDLPAALRPAALPALVGISGDGRVCAIGQASGYAELREAADATTGATTRAAAADVVGLRRRYWIAALSSQATPASPPATSSGSSGSA